MRGEWMAAVLSCGDGALLSHRSAAALWGLTGSHGGLIEITAIAGRERPGIAVHEGGIVNEERTAVDAIPVTTVARTLFDLAEVVDEQRLERTFEEADRLGLLEIVALEDVCARGYGRRALRPIRRLIDTALMPETTRSALEARFLAFCHEHALPPPQTNVSVQNHEVDALWPHERLVVEVDGWAFHRHRAAFERDRARDAAMQAAGYRVIRVTHRRLESEPAGVADELRRLLNGGGVPVINHPYGGLTTGTSGERGQGTVEWVGLLLVVALLCAALVVAGARVPGTALARAVGAKLLCAVAMAESCGDEPALIAAYGGEIGWLVSEHMPWLLFERGSRALPVDFRRCRRSACADGPEKGVVTHSVRGLPVTAFVHVIDCRADEATEARGADCSGHRWGNLYIQYWTYYADSATLRGVPIAERAGYHRDDWESVQIRIGPDRVDQRASSHHGYNYAQGPSNWGSDAGIGRLRDLAEAVGARRHNGWGPETGALLVSGGSHAGNATGIPRIDRLTPGRRVQLIPLEPIATGSRVRFAVSPPWRKRVWRDPEAEGTN